MYGTGWPRSCHPGRHLAVRCCAAPQHATARSATTSQPGAPLRLWGWVHIPCPSADRAGHVGEREGSALAGRMPDACIAQVLGLFWALRSAPTGEAVARSPPKRICSAAPATVSWQLCCCNPLQGPMPHRSQVRPGERGAHGLPHAGCTRLETLRPRAHLPCPASVLWQGDRQSSRRPHCRRQGRRPTHLAALHLPCAPSPADRGALKATGCRLAASPS